MKNYENLKFCPVDEDWLYLNNGKLGGTIDIEASEKLIRVLNEVRLEKGYKDIVDYNIENDVWYTFSIVFDEETGTLVLSGFVNRSEKDDYAIYALPMEEEDKADVKRQLEAFLTSNVKGKRCVA